MYHVNDFAKSKKQLKTKTNHHRMAVIFGKIELAIGTSKLSHLSAQQGLFNKKAVDGLSAAKKIHTAIIFVARAARLLRV